MTPYRVCYRQSASQPWQTKDFTDRASASAFHRSKRQALWAAMIQVWSAAEQRWIG